MIRRRKLRSRTNPVNKGPGTVHWRYNYIMDELEKRFPDPQPYSSSGLPESRMLDVLDRERLEYVNNMVQLLSQLKGGIMHTALEQNMEDFIPGDKVVIHSTSDFLADGQEVTVMGRYGNDCLIVLFDRAPNGYDPAIVITKHCVRKK